MGIYRFVEATPGGTLDILDTETAVHIIIFDLSGLVAAFGIYFDAANNFTAQRMYRFTNCTAFPIAVANYDGSITDTLLPGNILQAMLLDMSTEAGVWEYVQHISGPGEEDGA